MSKSRLRTPMVFILGVAATMVVTRIALGAAAAEELLYPAEHPANAGPESPADENLEWTTHVANRPTLTVYLPTASDAATARPRAACIICPGGGYAGLAFQKEGVEPAQWLAERGVAGFVLRYRCGGGKNTQPIPLEDAQRAIRLVRARASEWGVDPKRVGIWGFSAGGHLASTAGVFGDDGRSDAADPVDRQSSRPNFLVLVYPVINLDDRPAHVGSRTNLLGPDAPSELFAKWSSDRQVSDRTPPTFLVHASDDDGVAPENSIRFYQALMARKIPAELHIYETGGHGFGMLRGDRPADHWPEQLEPWLRGRGLIDP